MADSASSSSIRRTDNLLLRRLPAAELGVLLPQLEPVELKAKTLVLTPDGPVDSVLFVEGGTVSMLANLEDGAQIEVGLVGREGLVGLPLLFGTATSPVEAIVQADGAASRLPAAAFRTALAELPSLSGLLLRYVDAFHHQVTQSVACNGRHQIEQRLARWILMTGDRVEADRFLMTQEFMSHMLGVQRPGVNLAVGALQRAGLVQHARGQMRILDRPGLEAATCECYGIVQRRFAWLMDAPGR